MLLDDGSCVQYLSKSSCLSRKSYFDVSQSYCQWIATTDHVIPSMNQNPACNYQDPTISFETMFYIAVFVSIITSIFLRPIDKIFELLSAPLADTVKVKTIDTTMKKIGLRLSATARRVSVSVSNTASSLARQLGRKKAENFIAGTSAMIIPSSTKSAHEIAQASISLVISNVEKKVQFQQQNKNIQLAKSKRADAQSNKNHVNEDSNSDDNDDVDDEASHGSVDLRRKQSSNKMKRKDDDTNVIARNCIPINKIETEELFLMLTEDITCQRELLRPSEIESYDNQWGIDPTGEFVKGEHSVRRCFKTGGGAEENIKKEINLVKKVVNRKVEKLNLASDQHIEVEMLHLFVMDLLGRETPAARIFESKAREDFISTQVITMRTRVLCYVFLVAINFFFIFYSVLRGYQKGLDWQNAYLIACISQILVEIFLFETMETLWIQFFVPSLVSSEVQRVNSILSDTIMNLCCAHDDDRNLVLDATEYLFISTNLAKSYPDLMESVLILSYHTHLPGEISKKWLSGVSSRIYRHNQAHQSLLLFTTLFLLQSVATLPFLFHQMFIRFTQPFFLFGY